MNNKQFQIDTPGQNRLIGKWLIKHRIESVFIHSLEGQSISLLEYLAKAGIKIKVFCHDHFYICPQINLLYKGNTLCTNYEHGKKCDTCSPVGDFPQFEQNQIIEYGFLKHLKFIMKLFKKQKAQKKPELKFSSGTNDQLLTQLTPEYFDTFYAQRREKAIKALNCATKVYVPSLLLHDILLKSGVSESKLEVIRIGLPHLDLLKSLKKNSMPHSDKIRFCYRGSDLFHKGLHFLFEGIAALPDEIRHECIFQIYGVTGKTYIPENIRKDPSISLHPPFTISQIAQHINTYDIGILPHLWYENSPITLLEHLSSRKPIVCAELGGVIDFIEKGKTGIFYRAGNIESFCKIIRQIVNKKTEFKFTAESIVPSFTSFIEKLHNSV